jgi:hypothetical protein
VKQPKVLALHEIVRQGHRAAAQTTLSWAVVLLLALLVLAERFGLDVVLGAMLAGMVLRSWTRRMEFEVSWRTSSTRSATASSSRSSSWPQAWAWTWARSSPTRCGC